MIFYFTGTGNSLHVARRIADCQSDRLISIAALINADIPVSIDWLLSALLPVSTDG